MALSTGMDHEIELIPPQEQGSIPRAAILKALAHILSSKPFRTSKQCQVFLRYVVVHSADGKEDALKERVIGAEVLERSPNYNTADDPVVRIRAADVRKRLAMYYQEEGRNASIRITIPSGSYRAFFNALDPPSESAVSGAGPMQLPRLPEAHEAETAAVLEKLAELSMEMQPSEAQRLHGTTGTTGGTQGAEEALPARAGRRRHRALMAFWCALLVVVLGGLAAWYAIENSQKEFKLFWAPTIDQSRPPIIYVGNNAVYRLKASFLKRYQVEHPDFKPNPSGLETISTIDPNERMSFEDLEANDNDFVGIEDVASAVAISSFFKGKNVRYDLRFGRDIVFGDFRTTPVVLIGAFNNNWTLDLNDKLPYRFAVRNGDKGVEGEGHFWQTVYAENLSPREDYALITRQISQKNGEPVIAVAGVDQTGTRAAAEFVSNPAMLEAALRKLPSGWQNKKLQLVLHTTVVGHVPTGSEVIASSVQ
jgi:hypothetical protein